MCGIHFAYLILFDLLVENIRCRVHAGKLLITMYGICGFGVPDGLSFLASVNMRRLKICP